jgi:hypothetical protein
MRTDPINRFASSELCRSLQDGKKTPLTDFYPDVAEQLADLLSRIVASDSRIEHLNANGLPRNRGRLLFAELVARGLDGWVHNSVQTPCITAKGERCFGTLWA